MPDLAALVIALILDRPTCRDCIAVKSGLSTPELDATLTTVHTVVQIRNATDRCRVCGAITTVLSIDVPPGP
jgi:hypothetical protein